MRSLTKVGAAVCCMAVLSGVAQEGISNSGYHINLTDSLPRGVYKETTEPLTRGVLAVECLPQEWAELGLQRGWIHTGSCSNGTMPVLKQVVAVPGDTVHLTGSYVAINGEILLGTATLHLDSQGRWIPAVARGEYVLKADEYLLLADNIPNSWDGRYTGPAKRADIIATAKPIWTEERY